MIISLDTETTGVDLAHGAMPFIVTTCDGDGVVRFWEWDVDPLTRRPDIPAGDLADIAELVDAAELVYLHNSKFDARALARLGIDLPWWKVRDTFVASHILSSNSRHNLTQCCVDYLLVDIWPHEARAKEVVQACRALVKRNNPDWLLADEGAPGMPSVKAGGDREEDKPWKNDMWLPRAMLLAYDDLDPRWEDAASRYANADSEHTLPLGLEVESRIRESGLWAIYEHRLRLVRADFEMEERGVTARGDWTEAKVAEYEAHVSEAEEAMRGIAADLGHDLELAAGASLNDNMRDFFYGAVHRHCPVCRYRRRVKHWNGEEPGLSPDGSEAADCPKCAARKRRPARVRLLTERRRNLELPPVANRKTGNASLDAEAMREYAQTLDDGPALDFVELLADKRVYDTAIGYMDAYRRYWLPVPGHPGYNRIHASFNPCGTDHLRQSCNSPNLQNVAGEAKELSNRACFGPLPDREWWRLDYRQIEARIPAYESGEPKLVQLFDRPDDPPHWGSTYNLVASIFYPREYAPCAADGSFKKREPRLYKRAKFFWLARQYGAGRRKGDLLAGFGGASDMVERDLPLLAALQAKYLRQAERLGYVETLPDRTVDPTRGYPIMAKQTEGGRILSTTPFNYHVSGTACWVKNAAMVRCAERCREWRADGLDAWLILEVHDELLFDFPRGASMAENLPRALELRRLMERGGADLVPAMPTPVSLSYHAESWEDGVEIP